MRRVPAYSTRHGYVERIDRPRPVRLIVECAACRGTGEQWGYLPDATIAFRVALCEQLAAGSTLEWTDVDTFTAPCPSCGGRLTAQLASTPTAVLRCHAGCADELIAAAL